MTKPSETQVLIAGAGPIGVTAAIEFARRGVACRIVDPLIEPPQYAKAVGVQPRTLEVFEDMGVLRRILDAAVLMRGQIVYVNGERVTQLDMTVPDDVPFRFIAIPQYATEAILRDELAKHGVQVQRGVRVTGFDQDTDGVTAILAGDAGERQVRADYLIGADGAHSAVRKGLGLTFEGAAFGEQYMPGDVDVDWSLPRGYGLRSMHQTDSKTDDLLVCIPLPGRGRVFVAGDAAHIHPPTGAQGMNTGIQDAHNMAWKLALVLSGHDTPGLLESYDAERRPVGEEVVGRTVRSAGEGIGADSTDADYIVRREAQLPINCAGSPIVADGAGGRAPDATGLTRDAVTGPLRLFELLGRREHTTLLYAPDGPFDIVYLIAAPGAEVDATELPVVVDNGSEFAKAYSSSGASAYVVRPDGYLSLAAPRVDATELVTHLKTTFADGVAG